MKISAESSLVQSKPFADEKLFEMILEKKHLRRIINEINEHPKYEGTNLPVGNSHWQYYEVKGFSLNQETNLDSQDLGYVNDFESALRSSLLEAYVGRPN